MDRFSERQMDGHSQALENQRDGQGPDGIDGTDPVYRPDLMRFLWYSYGGALPAKYKTWVLRDLTSRTWWLRHFMRTTLLVAPLLLIYLTVIPSALSLRLLTGLTFAGAVYLFSLVNILVATDRKAVRAGYPHEFAADLRNKRSAERHRHASYQRRERIAERQAQRAGHASH